MGESAIGIVSKLKTVLGGSKQPKSRRRKKSVTVVGPRDHALREQAISRNALKVLHRLNSAGFQAFLVGGGVRDILLGHAPKDFDIATNATPEEIRDLFSNCRLIGRRFRLAHVYFQREIIEVATFRGHAEPSEADNARKHNDQGMLVRDNVYGSIEDDALRRDFTVNALYYNIADKSIWDHSTGLTDLKQRTLRLIGDPKKRLSEDPVRILRAIRLSAKLGLTIDKATRDQFVPLSSQLQYVPAGRLFDEVSKLFMTFSVEQGVTDWQRYNVLPYLFPETARALTHDKSKHFDRFIKGALINTDERLRSGKSITPVFLFAVLLWQPFQDQLKMIDDAIPLMPAIDLAADKTLKRQGRITSLPKYFSKGMKDIWYLQYKLVHRHKRSVWTTFDNPRFRASYDFLALRAQAGDAPLEDVAWWQTFQEADEQKKREWVHHTQNTDHNHQKTNRNYLPLEEEEDDEPV